MVIFWALVVGLIYQVVRAVTPGSSGPSERAPDARDVLDERFARGEISEDEYREHRRALETGAR